MSIRSTASSRLTARSSSTGVGASVAPATYDISSSECGSQRWFLQGSPSRTSKSFEARHTRARQRPIGPFSYGTRNRHSKVVTFKHGRPLRDWSVRQKREAGARGASLARWIRMLVHVACGMWRRRGRFTSTDVETLKHHPEWMSTANNGRKWAAEVSVTKRDTGRPRGFVDLRHGRLSFKSCYSSKHPLRQSVQQLTPGGRSCSLAYGPNAAPDEAANVSPYDS